MEKRDQINRLSAFRYRVVQDYELENLSNKKLWMTNPQFFNDPYDCAVHFSIDGMIEQAIIREIINSYSDKVPKEQCVQLAQQLWMSTKENSDSEAKRKYTELGVSLKKYHCCPVKPELVNFFV